MKKSFNIKGYTILRTMLAGLTLLCWWGLFLPQLLVNPDTCRVLEQEQTVESGLQEYRELSQEMDLYRELLQADEEQIVLKSRLWEYLKSIGWVE